MLKSSQLLSLLIFSLFISSSLFAQSPKVEWGTSTAIAHDPRINSLVGNADLGYFGLEYFPQDEYANIFGGQAQKNPYLNKNNLSMNLIHFGKDLQFKNSNKLDLGQSEKFRKVEQMLFSNGKLFVFSSLLDIKALKHKLFLQEIDTESLETKGEISLVSEIPFPNTKPTVMGGFSYRTKSRRYLIGSFDISWNSDSSKILIIAFPPARDKQAKNYVYGAGEFILLDNEMKVIWRDKMNIFPERAYGFLRRPVVDGEGNLYLFSNNMTPEENKAFLKQKERNYSYRFFAYNLEEKRLIFSREVFETGNKRIQDRNLSVTKKGELICTGVYTRHNYTNSFGGTFFFKLDAKSGEKILSSFSEFDLDFLSVATGWSKKDLLKDQKKGKLVEMGYHTYSLRSVVKKVDGGVFQIYESHSNSSSPNGGTTFWLSGDIMILNIGSEGKLIWGKFINKNQRMPKGMEIFNSHIMIVQGSELFFLFNDSEKNTSLKNIQYPETFKNPKKSRLVLVRIDAEGTFEKQLLNKFESSEVAIMPAPLIQNQEGEVLFLGQFAKKRRLGRLMLN